jgi:hypothetical protein
VVHRSVCRDCEQTRRTDAKNTDRGAHLIRQRASKRAHAIGVTTDFVLHDLGWITLVPVMRAMLSDPDALCHCGHAFLNERDIQLEHRKPPRTSDDYARHHARNIAIACGSCNQTKRNTGYADWLDKCEDARRTAAFRRQDQPTVVPPSQPTLFDQ